MIQRLIQIGIVLAVLLQFGSYYVTPDFIIQPKYQVSIMLEYHPGNPIHICNGAIIYEKLIITTANCMHFKLGPNRKRELVDPSVLSILAGSTNGYTQALRVSVSSIRTPEEFDLTTLENDLALLTLSKSLPLGTRPDMQWIMLDDNVHVNHSCLVNFFLRNTDGAIPKYYQTEELTLTNNEICRNFTDNPSARKDDICSAYVLPQRFDCAAADSFLSFNSDRGTGLICNSFLVGLLSEVVTRPDPKNNCSDINLTAMYTNIFPHLMWIYRIMANIETKYISTPYDSSLNPLLLNFTSYEDNEIVPKINETNSASFPVVTNSGGHNTTTLSPTVTNSTASWNSITTKSISDYSASWNTTVMNSTSTNTTLIPYVTNSTVILTSTWNSIDLSTTTSTTTLSPEVTASTDTYTSSLSSTAINTTTLSPTMSYSSTSWNSILANTTVANVTTSTVSQVTASWDSTVTKSSLKNTTLSTTIKNCTTSCSSFSAVNTSSTEFSSEEIDSDLEVNLTTIIHPALNSTSNNRPAPAPPARPSPTYRPYLPSTDSYVQYSTSTARNFPKNSSASGRLIASIMLIAVVSLRLIIYN